MTSSPDERLEELLSRIREAPPEERATRLEELCDDPDLRREAASLLPHLETRGGDLLAGDLRGGAGKAGSVSRAETVRRDSNPELPSERIGPYRLIQSIGEGGMGQVYEAEQLEPVRRRVALKLIKAGMDSRQVLARFEAERQALALMSHPGIAAIHDAGTTPSGHPYFVMDFIQGEPISIYCDRHKLSIPERIALLRKACDAVQHAHHKGIIHRDLKPSNILVRLVDGQPVPTIIDFGVAKATAQRLTEKTLFTQMGMMVGTPEYMSPEQAEMTGLDVDTRTDVYALGVILYELLVGMLPFDSRDLRQAGFDEIRRRIREDEPPRPSTKVSSQPGRVSEEAASRRRVTLLALHKVLKGELDWITMRALEKDRTRRYASPSDLGADLDRYLNQEPVQAGPPSQVYRIRKFVGRHRVGVTAAGLILMALLAGMSAAFWGLVRARDAESDARETAALAETEAATAMAVSDLMAGLFTASAPHNALGRTVTAKEILDRGARELDEKLEDQPQVRLRMTKVMGQAYLSLGLYEESRPLLEASLALARKLHGEDHDTTLDRMFHLGSALHQLGDFDESERLLRRVLEGFRRGHGGDHKYVQDAMALLGWHYAEQRRLAEAEPLLTKALQLRRAQRGDDDPLALLSVFEVGFLRYWQGRPEEALALHQEALEARRRLHGPDSPSTLDSMNAVAAALRDLGRTDEAEALWRECLERKRRVFGDDHAVTAYTTEHLGQLYRVRGRLDLALPLQEETLRIRQRSRGDGHPETLAAQRQLAITYNLAGRHDDAGVVFQSLANHWMQVEGESGLHTLDAQLLLGLTLARQSRVAEGDAVYARISSARRGDPKTAPPESLDYNLACYAAVRGWRDEAMEHLRRRRRLKGVAAWMLEDADLASLHGDPEFKEMFAELRQAGPRAAP